MKDLLLTMMSAEQADYMLAYNVDTSGRYTDGINTLMRCRCCDAEIWVCRDKHGGNAYTQCGGIGDGVCTQVATGIDRIVDLQTGATVATLRGNHWTLADGSDASEHQAEDYSEIADGMRRVPGLGAK